MPEISQFQLEHAEHSHTKGALGGSLTARGTGSELSRINVTWHDRQVLVDSRSRLPKTVKNIFSLASILFFKAKGSNAAC